MKYQLTISTDDLAELENLIAGNTATPGKSTKTVADKKTTKKPVKPEPEEEPEEEEDDLIGNEEEDEVTFESLQELVSEKAQEGLRDKIKKLLTSYKAGKLSDLDESKFGEFKEKLEKLK